MTNTSQIKVVFMGLLLMLGVSQKTFSQTINYKILEDDPSTKNLFIGLNFFDANIYSPNTSLGYNIYGNMLIGSKLQANIDYRKAYTDDNVVAVFAPDGLTKNWTFQMGVQLNLMNKEKKGKSRVVLSSTTSQNYTHTKYIMVPATFKRILALRGGIQQFYNNYQIDNDQLRVRTEDDIQYKDGSGNLKFVFDDKTYETINYTSSASGVYVGLDYKSIVNVRVKAEGYKEKRNTSKMNFYFDFLLCPVINYTLKPNDKQGQFNGVDINIDENEKKRTGWRFGWQQDMGKNVGFSVKAEVGQQPGEPLESWFLSCGIGMHIGAKVGGK